MNSSSRSFDVVVVGGGVAGFSTAINAARLGLSVLLIDKHTAVGGTTRKASAGMMVPNNRYLQELGQPDPREDFIKFLARVGRPLLYDTEHPTLGLPAWEHELISAYYDNASTALDALAAAGALDTVHQPAWPSYNEVAEDQSRYGRMVYPRRPDGAVGDGKEFIRQMDAGARAAGVEIRTDHRVIDVLLDEDGRVAGVRAATAAGDVDLAASRGVVFATGGFTHNAELRREYLNGMYIGGCAALTSEGDFVLIAKAMGIPLINMHSCWGAPVVFEQALARDPEMISSFTTPGDSIFAVNKYGRRVGNEKATYNDRTNVHFSWDPLRAEYPNFLLFPIWDERNTRLHARIIKAGMESNGNFIPQPHQDWSYVLKADTLDELAELLAERLRKLSSATHGIELGDDFLQNLRETIGRFNDFAVIGNDADFHRGETGIELHMHGVAAADNASPNRTMYPLSPTGPYYCTILAPGSIETKGGPKVNARLQVLGANERPVPGLYGVGNCVASASGQAYWSGGSTFGPYLTFGYLAAHALLGESAKGAPRASATTGAQR